MTSERERLTKSPAQADALDRSDPLGGRTVSADTAGRLRHGRSAGIALPEAIARSMSEAFDADLDAVRVHVDAEADRLATSLQATAFTVGSDIYFSRGTYAPGSASGLRLLAHELAHTLQPSSAAGGALIVGRADDPAERDADRMVAAALSAASPAPARAGRVRRSARPSGETVRRFVTAKEFREQTYEGPFTSAGAAQKAIEAMLTAYTELCLPPEDLAGVTTTKKRKKALRKASGAVPPDRIDQALALLAQMERAVLLWMGKHQVVDENAPSGEDAVVDDPNRRNRMRGMNQFLEQLVAERTDLRLRRAGDAHDVDQQAVATDGAAGEKLQKHYTGDFDSIFARLAVPLDIMLPHAGDGASFNVGFLVPIPDTPVMIGGSLRFLAARTDAGAVWAQLEVAPELAVGIPLGMIKAAFGGYVKASGKSAADAMTLLSYLLYRQLRESATAPEELTTRMWGGGNSRFHRLKADTWSRGIEKRMWGSDEAADDAANYVEAGSISEIGAKIGNEDVVSVTATAKLSAGDRYDRTSMNNRKGGAGERNRRSDGMFTKHIASLAGRGAEKHLSRRSYTLTLSEKVTAGPVFAGNLIGTVSLRQQGLRKEERKGVVSTDNWVVEEVSLVGRASAKLPLGGAAEAAATGAAELTRLFRTSSSKLAGEAKRSAAQKGGTVVNLAHFGAAAADVPPPPSAGFSELAALAGGGATAVSSAGVRLEMTGTLNDAGGDTDLKWTVGLDVRTFNAGMLSDLGYVTADVERSQRLFGLKWQSGEGGWKEGFSGR